MKQNQYSNMNKVTPMKADKKLFIDLFSGCGGLSYGFEQAGFECVLGVDKEKSALETFELNHPNAKGMNLDLSNKGSIVDVLAHVDNKKIDLIVAGPPCQGFSLTGKRQETDKRNTLFYSVFELAKKLEPQAIVIENVPGIATLYEGKARDAILSEFEKLGYSVSEKLIYAPDYGVPQIRKRMFFVGLRNKNFQFPVAMLNPNEYIGCKSAIGDLPSLENNLGANELDYEKNAFTNYQKKMRSKSDKIYNHIGTKHTELVKNVIAQVPEGGNHKDLPPGVGDSRKFNEAWTRYHSEKPSKTIDTGHRNHFHYKWNRVPTVRENARLQSFPDDFVFLGSKTQQYRQVGNAVPPLLGEVIGYQLLKYLTD